MSDLIKNEAEFIRNCATDIETGEPLEDDQLCNLYVIDAHRIADLIDAVEDRNKELTLQLLAVHGQAADVLDKAVVAKAKLTKAVAALDYYAKGLRSAGLARATLAELEENRNE
jgi:hypothetical protein